MNNLNYCLHEGNLTRDPEQVYTNTGTPLTKFSLAVNKSYKQGGEWKEEVSFFNFVAWGKTGENCAKYLKKGYPVRVVSEAKQDRWEQEGKIHSRVNFTVKEITFLPRKKDDQGGAGQSNAAAPIPEQYEDEIPF